MKKIVFLFCLTSLLSCSSDNDDNSNSNSTNTNYLPLTSGKYWTYDVVSANFNGRDSLYVGNDIIISNKTYKEFKTLNLPSGFYSSAMRDNAVRINGSKLLLTGSLSLADNQTLPINLDLSLEDFAFFDENSTNNQVIDSETGSFVQDYNGLPLTIEYTLSSKGGQNLGNYSTSNGDNYTNVRTSKIVLNVKISTLYQGFPITVLSPQDVLISTIYSSQGIGVVYTNTVSSYTINPLAASLLNGIPATQTQTQEEFLDTHN